MRAIKLAAAFVLVASVAHAQIGVDGAGGSSFSAGTPYNWTALQAFNVGLTASAPSAAANIFTLTDAGISNASNVFSFGPSAFTSPAELVETNNVNGQNVHVFQNMNANGFSAWTARGDDLVEHMAGGTSGSAASYLEAGGLVDYLEISHYAGNVPGYVKASFTASITGTVMTVTGSPTGTLAVGQHVYEAAFGTITQNTRIVSLGTGTGGAGTYNLNISQTQSSQTMISAFTPPRFLHPADGNDQRGEQHVRPVQDVGRSVWSRWLL